MICINETSKYVKPSIRNFVFRSFIFSCKIQKQLFRGVLKKGILNHFADFTGEHLCRSLFFDKVAGLGHVNLLKQRLRRRCFPVNVAKFLRKRFFYRTPQVAASEKSQQFTMQILKSFQKTLAINYITCFPSSRHKRRLPKSPGRRLFLGLF